MAKNNKSRDGIVYSTNPDYNFNGESDQEEDYVEAKDQTLYVRREVRNGKPVVVIKEFKGKLEDLKYLEKQLKNHCGVGGSNKDGDILIQGENKDKIILFLQKLGYKTKG